MRKQSIHTLCFSLLISCLLMLLSEYLLIRLMRFRPALALTVWFPWTAVFLSTCCIAFPAFFFLTKSLHSAAPSSRPLPVKAFLRLLLLCLCAVAGSFFLQAAAGFYTPQSVSSFDSPLSLLSLILFSCILSPVAEEWIFRKTLLDRLYFVSAGPRLLFGALVFALFHMNPFQFLYSFLLGLSLGVFYLCTGRLTYSILMHMLCNLWGAVFLPLLKLNLPYFPHKQLFYLLLAALSAACAAWGLFSFLHQKGSFSHLLSGSLQPESTPSPEGIAAPAAASGKKAYLSLFLNPSLLIYILICLSFMLKV